MSVDTDIGHKPQAQHQPFAPSSDIPKSDVWRAIQYVKDWFDALVPSVGAAPKDAQYLVAASDGTLTAERVTTNTATLEWDHATPAQAKANVITSGLVAADLLTLIKTVDGAASGLDADLLDGNSSAFFATAADLATDIANLAAHIGDTSDAHDASAISIVDAGGNYTATEAEAALAEVMDALQAHEADTSDAHDASAISYSPQGTIAATDVQAAITELDTELVERAQDAVGTILSDAGDIDFTYDDGTPAISAAIKADAVGPDELADTAVTPGSYTNTNLTVDQQGRITAASNGSAGSASEDFLINGNGQINQGAPASTADDAYGHDQWYALTQTGAIAPSSLSDVENGMPNMMRLTQSQASAQRMGYAQILEAQRCKKLRGKQVTFGGRLRYSNAAAVRYAILEWTGTADAVTSDVVNDWTSGTFTAGNFFLGSNLTVSQVGTITPSAATVTDFSVTATLGSSVNNVIVFVWTEGTAAQNSTLDFAAMLVQAAVLPTLLWRSVDEELRLCARYYNRFIASGAGSRVATGLVGSSTIVTVILDLGVRMRADPTFSTAAVGNWTVTDVGATPTLTDLTIGAITANRFCTLNVTAGAGGLTTGRAGQLRADNSSADLVFTARL